MVELCNFHENCCCRFISLFYCLLAFSAWRRFALQHLFDSKKKVFLLKNFKHYAIVGFFNSAFPFALFALASRFLDSGIAAILDGTVSMFEVLISIFFLKRFVDKNAILGVVFGLVGIIITYFDGSITADITWSYSFAVIAILAATASYAGASLYINAKCKNIDAITLAAGSVLSVALLLSPSLFFADFTLIDAKVATSLLGLGLLCTGIAYVLYFKLITEEGPRVAVSVVLLIPVFGTIFGAMFLKIMINITEDIQSLTDFKKHTIQFISDLKKSGRPRVLTVNGKAEIVVMDAAAFQKMQNQREPEESLSDIRQSWQDKMYLYCSPSLCKLEIHFQAVLLALIILVLV